MIASVPARNAVPISHWTKHRRTLESDWRCSRGSGLWRRPPPRRPTSGSGPREAAVRLRTEQTARWLSVSQSAENLRAELASHWQYPSSVACYASGASLSRRCVSQCAWKSCPTGERRQPRRGPTRATRWSAVIRRLLRGPRSLCPPLNWTRWRRRGAASCTRGQGRRVSPDLASCSVCIIIRMRPACIIIISREDLVSRKSRLGPPGRGCNRRYLIKMGKSIL